MSKYEYSRRLYECAPRQCVAIVLHEDEVPRDGPSRSTTLREEALLGFRNGNSEVSSHCWLRHLFELRPRN